MRHVPSGDRTLFWLALLSVAAITLLRVGVLWLTPLQLYPDEAQYWWWSQTPDWGYFSKPPLIAWIIWLTTRLSVAEWAIRLASPLLHAGTALLLFGIGRAAFSARVGLWGALAYATLPGISYSSGLISTDVPLLFCWALALYAFLRARGDRRWNWVFLCGSAVGVGLLAKYAMLYFMLGAAIAAIFDLHSRRLVLSAPGAMALVLALLILLPNAIWNAQHGFPTVAHTVANANWSQAPFNFTHAIVFLAGQFGVFGPLMMAGWFGALLCLHRSEGDAGPSTVLAAFSVPVLVLVVIQSFISDANANWAAPAYIAAVPLATRTLLQWWDGRALQLSLALGCAAMNALWLAELNPLAAGAVGLGNAFKRQEGWKELGRAVVGEAKRGHYDAIVAANRSVVAELLYYARPRNAPIRAWDQGAAPRDHFQMTMPLTGRSHRALIVVFP
ncbi:MAG: glycosyltransferase family 39 protein, partial [Alphaproteobacteria bacterium]|nr:glycosyltransferase family 39 protein [Alphaproteobacteria bacterium]